MAKTGVEAPQPSPAEGDPPAHGDVPDAGLAAAAQTAPGRLVVTAEVVRGQRSADGRSCHITFRVVTVDESGEPPVAVIPGDSLEAGTPCYTFTLHQLERGGTFRFHLLRRAGRSSLDAEVIGGRILRPLKGPSLPPK